MYYDSFSFKLKPFKCDAIKTCLPACLEDCVEDLSVTVTMGKYWRVQYNMFLNCAVMSAIMHF